MLYLRKKRFFPALPISLLTLAFLLIFNLPARSADCTDAEIEEQIAKFKDRFSANDASQKLIKCDNYDLVVSYLIQNLKNIENNNNILLFSLVTLEEFGELAQPSIFTIIELNKQLNIYKPWLLEQSILTLSKVSINTEKKIIEDRVIPNINIFLFRQSNKLNKIEKDILIKESARSLARLGAVKVLEDTIKKYPNNVPLQFNVAKGLAEENLEFQLSITITRELINTIPLELIDRDYDTCKLIEEITQTVFTNLEQRNQKELGELINLEKTINQKKVCSEVKSDLRKAIEEVEEEINQFSQFISQHQSKLIIVFFYGSSLSILYILLLFTKPLTLLTLNEVLKKYGDIPIPVLNFKFPLRLVVFGGLFHYHPRVLDAWVEAHLESTREEFLNIDSVKTRNIYIPVPVQLGDRRLKSLYPENLQPLFAKPQTRLVIHGEGGSGKSSLAFQIAKWAMSEDPTQQLCQHKMLPILIEDDFTFSGDPKPEYFLDIIHGKLQDLSNESEVISQELLEQLLRKERLLVIVDRFSELSKETQNTIRPDLVSFPVFSLIVTSRSENTLNQVSRTKIKPLRLDGAELVDFMKQYLNERGKEDLFSESEILYASGDISNVLQTIQQQQRNTTVLFAKLYAEILIAFKEEEINDNLPRNIPDLMLTYVNKINLNMTKNKNATTKEEFFDNRTVHQVLKIIAWECLKENYKPSPVKINQVKKVMEYKNADAKLSYLEHRLGLIKTEEPAQDKISFDLDPLAEYFAGLYLVEHYGDQEFWWQEFLEKAKKLSDNKEEIQGFLFAVKDCCFVKQKEAKIPHYVLTKLSQIISQNLNKDVNISQ